MTECICGQNGYPLNALSCPVHGLWKPFWRSIETAPKEQFILLYCPEDKSTWLAKWQGGVWYGVDDCGLTREGHSACDPDYVTGWFVSAWMPLPAPPRTPTLTQPKEPTAS